MHGACVCPNRGSLPTLFSPTLFFALFRLSARQVTTAARTHDTPTHQSVCAPLPLRVFTHRLYRRYGDRMTSPTTIPSTLPTSRMLSAWIPSIAGATRGRYISGKVSCPPQPHLPLPLKGDGAKDVEAALHDFPLSPASFVWYRRMQRWGLITREKSYHGIKDRQALDVLNYCR